MSKFYSFLLLFSGGLIGLAMTVLVFDIILLSLSIH